MMSEMRRLEKTQADEDMEVSGGIGEMDQSLEYIAHFAKVVKLY